MAHLDKVAVWQRTDGGVSITHFDTRDMLPGEMEDGFISRTLAKHGTADHLSGITPVVILKSDIPQDRSDRNEWSLKNGKVIVDPAKVASKQAKEAKRRAILTKIGITEEEFKEIK